MSFENVDPYAMMPPFGLKYDPMCEERVTLAVIDDVSDTLVCKIEWS